MNVKEVIQAYEEGRTWRQDWFKLTGALVYVAGMFYDLSLLGGAPRANVYPGSMVTATKLWHKSGGAIWHGGNTSPRKKHIVNNGVYTSSSTAGLATYTLADYLMFYPLIDFDLSDEQVFSNPITLPRYPDGEGVMAFIVCTSDAGASDYYLTIKYTNSKGEAKENPFLIKGVLSAIPGQILHAGAGLDLTNMFLPLAAGDTGIRSIQSVQLDSGSGAGWGCLVLCKPLLTQTMETYVFPSERSQLFHHPQLPEVKDEAFLSVIVGTGGALAASSRIMGYLDFVW